MPPSSPILVNGEPLRIAWGSNSPRVPFSYGGTTALVVPTLRDQLGCEMAVSATYGEQAGKITWYGIPVYPQGFEPWGNDIHAPNAKQHRAHLLITHQDVPWQEPEKITAGGARWAPWFPIDHAPLSHEISKRLDPTYCYQPIVLSRFGAMQAQDAGIDVRLVPQGVKTRGYGDATLDRLFPPYVPGDRADARRALGWPQDAFIVGMVAANSGSPDRKAYFQNLSAFRRLAEQHDDAHIYIHAYGDDRADKRAMLRLGWPLGDELLESGRVLWAHPYDLNAGYPQSEMVLRYQAMDVLLGVSMAEGCGLPLLEAQACGIPVIAGNWSAMAENVFSGWRVEEHEAVDWPVPAYEAFWKLPEVYAIHDRLEEAYSALQSEFVRGTLAMHARRQIEEHHDQAEITETYWRPVLAELAARIEAEPSPWHVHRWASYGHQDSTGAVVAPCLVANCPAERLIAPGGTAEAFDRGAPLIVGGIALDIEDDPIGGVARSIAAECERVYRLQDFLYLAPGAVILDIGAHVGIVSCYLAKRFPQARILAFEPHPENFKRLIRNLDANGCHNVFCYPLAVTDDGRMLTLHGDHTTNTGGYSAWAGGADEATVASVAIDAIWQDEGLIDVAILKLDCEGAEYEIIYALGERLRSVGTLVMEVHENRRLGPGLDLVQFASSQVGDVRATVIRIPDAPARDVRATMEAAAV